MDAPIPAAQAPTEFDSNLSTWITNQHTESIFHIRFSPRKDMIKGITILADQVKTVTEEDGERSDRVNSDSFCTGFVVAGDNHRLRLLACAHGLDHLFKRSHPISFSTANKLIATTVCCDHLEHQYRQGGLIGERPYSNASIIAIDCAHDLMLVDVVIDNLRDMHGAICHNSHRSVRLAREVMGDKISKCLLLSWPPQKHRKRTEGHTSTMRRVTEISEPNLNEYNMDLVEVNMGVESGSSGGPLFNGAGEVLGLLHAGGVFDDTDSSYFVPVHHLHNFVAPYV